MAHSSVETNYVIDSHVWYPVNLDIQGEPLDIQGEHGNQLDIQGEPLDMQGEHGNQLDIQGEHGNQLDIQGEPLDMQGEHGNQLDIQGEHGNQLDIQGEHGNQCLNESFYLTITLCTGALKVISELIAMQRHQTHGQQPGFGTRVELTQQPPPWWPSTYRLSLGSFNPFKSFLLLSTVAGSDLDSLLSSGSSRLLNSGPTPEENTCTSVLGDKDRLMGEQLTTTARRSVTCWLALHWHSSFLKGNATLHLYPQLKELQKIDGFVDFLTTEVSTSKQKKFPLITFIDTPGLVDGDMEYPFDVDTAVTLFGDMADLIFVLFDPIGQALCKRTLNIVESLNAKYPERIFFFLSKADTAGTETDRQRVMMQITQELCKRRGLNKPGLKMPTIFIPSLTAKDGTKLLTFCDNRHHLRLQRKSTVFPGVLHRVVKMNWRSCAERWRKPLPQNIQNTLNTLEKDAVTIATQIDAALESDRQASKANFRACTRSLGLYFLGLLPVFMLFLSTLATQIERKVVEKWLGAQGADVFYSYVLPVSRVAHSIPFPFPFNFATIIFFALLVIWIARMASRSKPTLSRKETRLLLEKRQYVNDLVKKKKSQLYSEYLQQCVGSLDLA
eukprot:Em0015g366a